jgi:hypothetical protein
VSFTFYRTVDCTGPAEAAGSAAVDPSTGIAHPSASEGPLAPGSYSFTAHYSGDATYAPADAACEPLRVTAVLATPKVETEIHDAWHHPVTSVPAGSKVHDKATVTGSAGTPTGTVSFTFFRNGTCNGTGEAAGTVTLVNGVAHPSDTKGPLAAGSYAFKAHYNGDAKYTPADSACEPLTVTQKPPQCKPGEEDRGKGSVKDEKGGNGGDFNFNECDDNQQASHKDKDHNVDFQSNRHDPPKCEPSSSRSRSSMSTMGLELPTGMKATTIGEGTNNGKDVTYVLVVTDLGLGLGNLYSLTLSDDTGIIYTRTGTLLSGEVVVRP